MPAFLNPAKSQQTLLSSLQHDENRYIGVPILCRWPFHIGGCCTGWKVLLPAGESVRDHQAEQGLLNFSEFVLYQAIFCTAMHFVHGPSAFLQRHVCLHNPALHKKTDRSE
jgi:hypothetical protein